ALPFWAGAGGRAPGAAGGGGRAVAEPPLGRDPREREPPRAGEPPREGKQPREPRLTLRRLFGLDRSGPPPAQTQAGQPLRPWTIPNTIGFARLAVIPVFLVVALSRRDGGGAAGGPVVLGERRGPPRRGDPRGGDPPVQPPGSPDGPGDRPPAGGLGRGRELALRSASTLGAGRAGRARALDARARALRP